LAEEDGIFSFAFGGDDMPDGLEALLRGLARKAMDTGLAHDPTEDKIMPSKEQLNIAPGDCVAVMHMDHGVDEEFCIAEVLYPEQHAETYPDWEDRLLKSFVLTRWYTGHNLHGKVGWIPRARLILVDRDHFDEMYQWLTDGHDITGVPPTWLVIRYAEAMVGHAEANHQLPNPIRCPECESPAVIVTIHKSMDEKYTMGIKKEGQGKEWGEETPFHVMVPYTKDYAVHADIECKACGYEARLPDEIEMFG